MMMMDKLENTVLEVHTVPHPSIIEPKETFWYGTRELVQVQVSPSSHSFKVKFSHSVDVVASPSLQHDPRGSSIGILSGGGRKAVCLLSDPACIQHCANYEYYVVPHCLHAHRQPTTTEHFVLLRRFHPTTEEINSWQKLIPCMAVGS